MNKSKLFIYCVLWHPNEQQFKDGQKSKIVIEPTNVLALDEQSAGMIAVRKIPDQFVEQLDQIEVAIKAF